MQMPFGRWRGHALSSVPSSYLKWMVREIRDLDPHLRRAAEATLRQRGEPNEPPEQPRYSPPADVRGVVKSWYREMAKRFHPDRTLDDGKAMSAINCAHERLREMLGLSR